MRPESSSITRRRFLGYSAGAVAASSLPAFAWEGANRSFSNPAPAGGPHRIILDTDPGVDDAMAFFLTFRSPELKVEAVTPVSGNVPLSLTLPNALRLLEICNRGDVPVAAGAATPLTRRLITARYAHGNNGLGGVDFPEPRLQPINSTATELIRKIVRANPGEITIVAVGPLTNVATLLKEDPSIATLIKAIVMMGGSLSGGNITPCAEFNYYVDPEAARIVFDSGVPLTMVGLDVTRKVLLHEENIKAFEAANNPIAQAAGKIMRSSFDRIRKDHPNPSFAMHDPLTVAHLIDPTILTLKDYYVQIETRGEITAGQSIGWEHAPVHRSPPLDTGMPMGEPADSEFKANCKVAVDVDVDKFFKLLVPRITNAS
jgi:inosine-uridine nucleoside N-ribohydrolase